MQPIDLERLTLIGQGHAAFQLLWAGTRLGVFDALAAGSMSSSELAQRVGLDAYPCRVLLTGLTALGLLEKHDERFSNAALTMDRLVRGRPDYLGDVLGWQAEIVYPGLLDFLPSLRRACNVGLERFAGEGDTIYERLSATPELEDTFHRAMIGLSAQANEAFASAIDFDRFTHIVDAGGGAGHNAVRLARRYRRPRFTVVDRASVSAIARKNIETCGLADRIDVRLGDLMRDDAFPEGADAIVYCHLFTIWSLEEDLALLRRAYDALPKGGSVILFNMMGNDDDTGPLSTALGSCYFLGIATGRGMLHSWRDYETILRDAGFADTQRIEGLPLDHGIIIGTK